MKTKIAPYIIALVASATLYILNFTALADTSLTYAGYGVPNGIITFTPKNTDIFDVRPNLADGKEIEVQVVSDDLVQWWGVYFLSPWEGMLEPGEYMDWTGGNYFKLKEPSLGLWGTPSGPGTSNHSGWFNVLTEIEWNPDSTLKTAAIDFLYFNDKNVQNWTAGSFRYNSDIPVILIPETSPVILLIMALVGFISIRTRKRQ